MHVQLRLVTIIPQLAGMADGGAWLIADGFLRWPGKRITDVMIMGSPQAEQRNDGFSFSRRGAMNIFRISCTNCKVLRAL